MGKAFLYGSGGANPLNYKVIGGTTQPVSPSENTIWVNTDTEISGYVFASTEPTGTAGLVWIKTDLASNAAFNALKKDSLYVYPLSAAQYVNGAWVKKYISVYQNGDFIELATTFFPGLEYATFGGNKANCSVSATELHIASTTTYTSGSISPTTQIDCSKYSTLKFTVSSRNASGNGQCNVGVRATQGGDTIGSLAAGVSVTGTGVFSVDISSITTYMYIVMSCWGSTGNANFTVTKIEG